MKKFPFGDLGTRVGRLTKFSVGTCLKIIIAACGIFYLLTYCIMSQYRKVFIGCLEIGRELAQLLF